MPAFPGFIGGSNTTQSPTADCERTVNLYVEQMQGDAAANKAALFPTPGFRRWSAVVDTGGRAAVNASGRLFMVIGGGFYEFDLNGTATLRGTVAVDGNPAMIVYNGLVGGQLGIISGGNVYPYDLTTNLLGAAVLTGGFTHLAYAAGFGLALNLTTGVVRLSNLNDFTVWDPGTFFQRSLFADPYQAMFVDANNLVWMLGTDTFEVRYNTGIGDQPFEPLSGLVGRYGIAAPFAFGQSGLGNFWLARNQEGIGQFVITRGASPSAVSTYALNTAVAGYLRNSQIDNTELLTYQQEGHTFACLSFPAVPATWAFDIEGQSWAERGRWTNGHYELWAPRVHAFAFGKHLIADRTTGILSEMDTTLATEVDGSGIRRLRRAPLPSTEHRRIPIDQFELHMDVGLGLSSGQGSNPQALLRVSTDAGRTWGNEQKASVGRMGEYGKRCYWTRLGSLASGVLEVTYSEPTPFRLVNAWLNNAERAA